MHLTVLLIHSCVYIVHFTKEAQSAVRSFHKARRARELVIVCGVRGCVRPERAARVIAACTEIKESSACH